MRKSIIVFFFCITGIVITAYLFYNYYRNIGQGYKIDWEMPENYMWIFQDSVKANINRDITPVSCVNDSDILTLFNYKNEYDISIWNFKQTIFIDFHDINIIINPDLENYNFESGLILNQEADLEFSVRKSVSFSNIAEISLDKNSKIFKEINNLGYKGFYGEISKLALTDKNGVCQIIVKFTNEKTPALCLFYKNQGELFFILINSVRGAPLNEMMVNILNLT